MNIKNWIEFEVPKNSGKKSAGIIIILNKKKMLLCHSTGDRRYGSYSFPKGKIEEGESEIDAAIRELKEEVSIVVNKEMITNKQSPIVVEYNAKSGLIYKKLFLYTVYIKDISEIGLESETLPKEMLQLEEIDWAGFLDKEKSRNRIFHRVGHLLDLID